MDLVGSPAALRRWSVASLLANLALIVTGGLVRVTGSGLGCSTWPQCEPGSYAPHPAAGAHAFIEFGNRLLTFALVAVAIGTLVAAWKARDVNGRPRLRVRGLALAAAAGIPAQAVIGGISVLTQLNPWVVGLHLVVSIALVMACVVLVHEAYGSPPAGASSAVRVAVATVFALGSAAMLIGIAVTGAGPNSGAGGAERNGLELVTIARVHSLTVWGTLAATLTVVWLARRNRRLRAAALLVLGTEIIQGAVGYAQYTLGLPPALVALHMVGTALFTASIAHLAWLARPAASAANSNSVASNSELSESQGAQAP